MKNLITTLHWYRFNTENESEKEEYLKLCETLKKKGLKVFDSLDMNLGKSREHRKLLETLNLKTIELETEYLFSNQWNTAPLEGSSSGLRVFDWSETIFPNKKTKEGYWLDQTPEMTEIRNNTYKCGYCGKQEYFAQKPTGNLFCTKCRGSEYLEEKDLQLLLLRPISKEYVNYKNIVVPGDLIKDWKEQKKATLVAKLEQKKVDKLAQLKKDVVNAQKEYDAFLWLINKGIDYENVIYYSHTDTFSFGWRKPIEDKEKLSILLAEFPYKWEFSKK